MDSRPEQISGLKPLKGKEDHHYSMTSFRAILSGAVFIIVASLVLQFAYLFLAIAYNSLAQKYPVMNEFRGIVVYMIALPLMLLIMYIGGYITAYMARYRVVLHSLVVGCFTVAGMLWYAMSYMHLTLSGLLMVLLAIGATVVGGLGAQKDMARTLAGSR